jgi:hypothetical protein
LSVAKSPVDGRVARRALWRLAALRTYGFKSTFPVEFPCSSFSLRYSRPSLFLWMWSLSSKCACLTAIINFCACTQHQTLHSTTATRPAAPNVRLVSAGAYVFGRLALNDEHEILVNRRLPRRLPNRDPHVLLPQRAVGISGTGAHPRHICAGTGLTPPTSASGLLSCPALTEFTGTECVCCPHPPHTQTHSINIGTYTRTRTLTHARANTFTHPFRTLPSDEGKVTGWRTPSMDSSGSALMISEK